MATVEGENEAASLRGVKQLHQHQQQQQRRQLRLQQQQHLRRQQHLSKLRPPFSIF